MSTMLSLLQHVDKPDSSLYALEYPAPTLPVTQTPTDIQRKELKVLSALATVLVTEHEKVAVVAKHGNGSVEVYACTDKIAAVENAKSFHENLKYLWNFIVTENIRDDAEKDDARTYPTIHNPKENPDHPRDFTLDKLLADVKNHWHW
jgi:hypothetical protein